MAAYVFAGVRRRVRGISGLAAVLAALGGLFFIGNQGTAVAALFREEDAVRIDPDTVEGSTLIIGTHLIYLHALNNQIYAVAVDSAADSGQDRRYYKSELAGGMWVDITDAGSIRDITAAGTAVDADVIASLYFTHHTKSDKITYALRTNAEVGIFDIYDVYDLERMPELEPLKLQYDMMRESKSSTRQTRRNLALVKNFFSMETATDTTKECDDWLNALQGYYDELAANGAGSKDLETVLDVMEKISNARRTAVYGLVDDGLSALQDAAADVSGSEIQPDDALLAAIGDSQGAVLESMGEAQGNMLAKGETVISETEYLLAEAMTENAQNGSYADCDEQNWKLQYVDNIVNGRIVNRQEEMTLLDEMIEKADVKYGRKLSGGVSQAYTLLVSQSVSHAALQSRIKEDMSGTNAVRGEMEFFVQGKADRLENSEAQQYILLRIQDAAKFQTVIPEDDYSAENRNSVSEYKDWLNSLLDSIKRSSGGSQAGGGESLYEQKAALQEQKLTALDALDLDTAKKIDALIADIDGKLDVSEEAVTERLEKLSARKAEVELALENAPQDAALQAELGRLEVEIAQSRTGIPEDSQTANIMKCKNELLSLLADGADGSDSAAVLLESDADVLISALEDGSALALETLKEVYRKLLAKSELEGVQTYKALQDKIENAVSESVVSGGLTGELSVQGAQNIIADALGMESLYDESGNISAGIPGEDLSAALLALGDFHKNIQDGQQTEDTDSSDADSSDADNFDADSSDADNSDAEDKKQSENAAAQIQAFTENMAAVLAQREDSAVFQAVKQGNESYVPAQTLAEYLGYRYVWNDTKKNAVLSKGRYFFSFTAFRDDVENEEGEALYMDSPAVFSGELCIPGSFVEKYFSCRIYDISGTEYAVLVSDKAVEKSQEIFLELREEGGVSWVQP